MAIPPKKYAIMCFVLYSKGLPQSLRSLAMTTKKKYVILSVSEISHDLSEKYMPYGNTPSREIASLRSQRQLIFRVIASVSVAISLKEYAVYTPYFVPTDCRGRFASSQ